VAARDIVPVPGARFEETLASASPDVLREMIKGFAQRMMDADVEVRCNAGYGEVTPQRVNSRNGYRQREWDTRAGTIELAIPKLRAGSYYPEFLEHRRRAERALASVVATSYLLGVSTRQDRLSPASPRRPRCRSARPPRSPSPAVTRTPTVLPPTSTPTPICGPTGPATWSSPSCPNRSTPTGPNSAAEAGPHTPAGTPRAAACTGTDTAVTNPIHPSPYAAQNAPFGRFG
jgi:mutator family transposase